MNRFAKELNKRGLSDAQCAELLKLVNRASNGRRLVWRWRNNKCRPSDPLRISIEKVFGIPRGYWCSVKVVRQ